jgi:hypothetical protein
MVVTLSCPQCGEALSVAALPGRQIRCGNCDALFPMPQAAVEVVPEGEAILQYATPLEPARKGMAIAAMVLGIVAIPGTCFVVGPLLGTVAVVLGIVALVRAKRRPAEYGGKGMAIAGICTGTAAVILILPSIIWLTGSSFSQPGLLAKRGVCASQLQAIGASCQVYAANNAGWAPPDLDTLIAGGMLSPAYLQCPSDPNVNPAVIDYIYIPPVPGFAASAQADWIIAYEDPANHQGEGGNVLYADMHVEFLKTESLKKELDRIRRAIKDSDYADHPWYRGHPLLGP